MPPPPPPPPPHEDEDEEKGEDEVLAQVIVNCGHAFRFNKHTIADATGDRKGEDEFAVVPPREGDTIYMRISPESEMEHVRLYWDDTRLPADNLMIALAPYGYGTRDVDYIDADVENPLWLYTKEAILRRTVWIRVDGRGADDWNIPIRIYPRDSAQWDGLKHLEEVRGWLGDWFEVLEEKLSMLIDDFEFEFLPKETSELGAEFQWRELPLAEEGVVPQPDYRAMFWWKIGFVFDPFLKLGGTLEISMLKTLNTFRKWSKGTWAEKSIAWLLEEVSGVEAIYDALNSARLELSPTFAGGGSTSWARKSPDETLDIGPKEDGAPKQMEGLAKVGLEAKGLLDTASALLFLETKLTLELSFSMGAKFRYGAIAKLAEGEKRDGKLGMYLQASTTGLKGRFAADVKLPGTEIKPVRKPFEVLEESESDVLRWIWLRGEDTKE